MAETTNVVTETSSKSSILIPKLKSDGSNWVLYHSRLIDYINGQPGYRRHFTGREKEPTDLSDADKKDDAKVEAHEDLLDAYYQKQSAIRSIIMGTLPETIQVWIFHSKPVDKLWDALCEIYQDQNVVTIASMIAAIHRIKTPVGGDPNKTIAEILQKSNDLAAAGGSAYRI